MTCALHHPGPNVYLTVRLNRERTVWLPATAAETRSQKDYLYERWKPTIFANGVQDAIELMPGVGSALLLRVFT